MSVVFDTNVFVSAFTRPEGRASLALERIVAEWDQLFISQPIIEELLRVLVEKFHWNRANLAMVTRWIDQNAHLVMPTETLHILADEPDNRILECAIASHADLIVTGDRAMLALETIENTRIVTLAEYLNTVDNSLINN